MQTSNGSKRATVKANWPGTCPNCGKAFAAGTAVSPYTVDGKTKWGHVFGQCPTVVSVSLDSLPVDVLTAGAVAPVSSAKRGFSPNHQQVAIFEAVKAGTHNIVVNAGPGTGKSTTIEHCLEYLPRTVSALMASFNVAIKDAMTDRLRNNSAITCRYEVKTWHGVGFGVLRQYAERLPQFERGGLPDVKNWTNQDKIRNILQGTFIKNGYNSGYWNGLYPIQDNYTTKEERDEVIERRSALLKLVSLARATLVNAESRDELLSMCDFYGIELNGAFDEVYPLVAKVLDADAADLSTIDYDDMIYLPVRFGLTLPKFDWVFVDETQDLNRCQLELMLRSMHTASRAVIVGDRWQSLYGFRGAHTGAMDMMAEALHAVEYPLSISYRLPKAVVKFLNERFPHIPLEALDTAPEGLIDEEPEKELASRIKPGHMVMCRTVAPLVDLAFVLIAAGIKVSLRGRDFAKDLNSIVKELKAKSMPDMYAKLARYHDRKRTQLTARNAPATKLSALDDKVAGLTAIMDKCRSVNEVSTKIAEIFDNDEVAAVVLGSVHSLKGLEAETVHILMPELMPHPRAKLEWEQAQEANCEWVAYSRTKLNMYMVKTDSALHNKGR